FDDWQQLNACSARLGHPPAGEDGFLLLDPPVDRLHNGSGNATGRALETSLHFIDGSGIHRAVNAPVLMVHVNLPVPPLAGTELLGDLALGEGTGDAEFIGKVPKPGAGILTV